MVDETVAPNLVFHDRPFPDIVGCDTYKQYITSLHTPYSGLQLIFDEIIGESYITAARWMLTGTHAGQSPTMRISPSGKQVTITG